MEHLRWFSFDFVSNDWKVFSIGAPLILMNLFWIQRQHMENVNVMQPPCCYCTLRPLWSGNGLGKESLTWDKRCEALKMWTIWSFISSGFRAGSEYLHLTGHMKRKDSRPFIAEQRDWFNTFWFSLFIWTILIISSIFKDWQVCLWSRREHFNSWGSLMRGQCFPCIDIVKSPI